MLYDVLTYTCESTERFAAELHKYEQLLQKTGTTRFEVIDLFNRTGFILSRFQSQSEMMRGQAINAEVYRQLIDANAIDAITAQPHQGRTLYSLGE